MHYKEFLGTELPIIQSPMAGVQDSALTIAVSAAGGLGSLPCAMLDAQQITAEVEAIQAQTTAPFNLNFFCHTLPVLDAEQEALWHSQLEPFFAQYNINPATIPAGAIRKPFSADIADAVERYRPPVVSFHFGLPEASLLAKVKAWGATVLSSATTVQEALWLEANGADGIIAQGLEAGGHRGMFLTDDVTTQMGTFALLPQIVQSVKIPVIAAGGIAGAKGVAVALSLGATAVQVGTAYLLSTEAKTSALHRAALKSDKAQHTALTNVFSGRPARSIVNRAVAEIGPISQFTPQFPLAATAIGAIRKQAETNDNSAEFSPLWCGQNATGCKEQSAADITCELCADL